MQFANMQIISPTVFNVDSHLTTLSLHAGQHWPLWDLLVISRMLWQAALSLSQVLRDRLCLTLVEKNTGLET